ncbi:MAG TPA: hypothetical protein ENM99_02470 [Desulfurella acetivorans]|uniref:Rhodanese domain-containing protein n=1 Tax=Desulfurella acetivorans TaxID=33002 RepID=A0A7C6E934_DESAE|nr:hypothetical protein [Desulfurella acetivorans]
MAINPAFFLTNATRVIFALKWAGVENVYFMNGGFEKWADEKRPFAIQVTLQVVYGLLKGLYLITS